MHFYIFRVSDINQFIKILKGKENGKTIMKASSFTHYTTKSCVCIG